MEGIVAAGAKAGAGLQRRGVQRIPLLSIGGSTLLQRMCLAMLEGGDCSVVHVLAPAEVPLPADARIKRAAYSGELVDDFLNLLAGGVEGEYILLGGADTPLITPESLAALCAAARERQADVGYPVCERSLVEAQCPGTQRTYARLRGLTVTGGNVFWLKRSLMLERGALLKNLFALRKNPVGLARLFGLGFMLRFLLGWVDLAGVERHLGRIVGGRLCALQLPYAELAVDLDKEADLDFFAARLDPWQ